MEGKLKSVFISVFPLIALALLVYTIYQGIVDFSFVLLGQAIIAGAIVRFFSGLFITKRPRTDSIVLPYTLPIIIGYFIAVAGAFYEGVENQNLILPSLLSVLWIAYLRWYSVFNNRQKGSIIKVGEKLKKFSLENTDKQVVHSDSYLGKATIFIFYRGNWCPLCMAQIKEVAGQYKELESRNIRMVLVSPQPHQYTQKLAKKFNVGFEFMVDARNKAAKQLGILSENGIPAGFQALGYDSDTVMPTVIITDTKNKIIFADLTDNYRVRPEPETFLRVIDELD
ncbi:redoxin domain-containing protein [Spongiivirga sp. MCCC 1A20706]|uniref:peroxiredoxin family protein n=1 Tax=Spongiivirga sp. MCCC 1A20706 TaxID=3160963 RepID=UPI003977B6E0